VPFTFMMGFPWVVSNYYLSSNKPGNFLSLREWRGDLYLHPPTQSVRLETMKSAVGKAHFSKSAREVGQPARLCF
jgi:hypothetical protein